MSKELALDPINTVLERIATGEMVVMVDDVSRENEGDIVIATEKISGSHVAFMACHARGLICVSITLEQAERLRLSLQSSTNLSRFDTPFLNSVDHVDVSNRGMTAESRAYTMRRLASPDASPDEFISPGHVFPLLAHPLGVLSRRGQTEGSCDIARLAGCSPSGVICEILSDDGTMARDAELLHFIKSHNLSLTSVEAVRKYRVKNEEYVRCTAESQVDLCGKEFIVRVYEDYAEGKEHLALILGNPADEDSPPLVRIHSECLTGDVFGSSRCDCGPQLEIALQKVKDAGSGVILYLRQEGRGIGLTNKIRAYSLQDTGLDTVEANLRLGFQADEREFAVSARILEHIGITSCRLLTNNPKKIQALKDAGLPSVDREPVVVNANEHNSSYLATKKSKLGHLF